MADRNKFNNNNKISSITKPFKSNGKINSTVYSAVSLDYAIRYILFFSKKIFFAMLSLQI